LEVAMRGQVLALLLLAAGAGAAGAAEEKAAPGKQVAQRFEKGGDGKVTLDYLLYLPKGYDKGEKAWPLLLFLHGAGESGNDLSKVKKHGPPKLVAAGKDLPFIIVSPQSRRRGWQPGTLNALLDDVSKKYRVDADRVYVTGLSMGGFGTWALAASRPDRFAAIVPICGGGNPKTASKLKDLPVWVFHGGKDRAVPVERSEAMVKALKDAGSKSVEFTLYPEAGHDSWTKTYNNPKLYEWLLAHKRQPAGKASKE
jgi:predicted peptidase